MVFLSPLGNWVVDVMRRIYAAPLHPLIGQPLLVSHVFDKIKRLLPTASEYIAPLIQAPLFSEKV
jgi:hypothetical protein